MLEAVELTKRGVTVDVDTVEGDLHKWLTFFLERGGDARHITVSSDAAMNSPRSVWDQVRSCVIEHKLAFESLLPMITRNAASVLKLGKKGLLQEGADADLVVLRRDSLEIEYVIAKGRRFVENGKCTFRESFLESSNREVKLHGDRA
jgi:beta-aspartyl-dipeptidase (metallo-type)